MDYNRVFVLNDPLMSTLHHLMDIPEETEKAFNAPTRTYVRDAKAMASTPADVKELPSSYVFVVDMPGVKSGEIKVQVEDDNILVISGERKREEDKEGKFLRMERRMGKFMRRFSLPDNANTDAISAMCQDGVLTVTVHKLPPPEPKKPKTMEDKDGNVRDQRMSRRKRGRRRRGGGGGEGGGDNIGSWLKILKKEILAR